MGITLEIRGLPGAYDNTDLIIFNKSGFISRIKVKNIPIKQRATSCVKLIESFPEKDQIICVLKVDDFV